MKISIIIPVYNVERYLEKCLDSVINGIENKSNIEVLLIDDGSTDNSRNIVDKYSNEYSYVKAYHKENGGLSDARNYGLLIAEGDYIIFIDSDDEVNSELFKSVIKKIENSNCEILLWDAVLIDENGKIISSDFNNYFVHKELKCNTIYSGIEFIDLQLQAQKDFVTTVWLGAYKKSFLYDNQLLFEKGLLHEDEMWSIKVFINAEKIEYIGEKIYLYRQRNNSIMNKKNRDYNKNLKDIIYIYSTLYSYINWKIYNKKIKNEINSNISRRYLHAIGKFDGYKYKEELKKINYIQLIKNSSRMIDKIRGVVLKISPYIYCKISKSNKR